LGRPLAGERTKAETAYEFMHKLIDKVEAIRVGSRFGGYLSHASRDIEALTSIYQKTLFAHHFIDRQDARLVLYTWKHLRLRLWITRLYAALMKLVSAQRMARLLVRGERVVDSNQ